MFENAFTRAATDDGTLARQPERRRRRRASSTTAPTRSTSPATCSARSLTYLPSKACGCKACRSRTRRPHRCAPRPASPARSTCRGRSTSDSNTSPACMARTARSSSDGAARYGVSADGSLAEQFGRGYDKLDCFRAQLVDFVGAARGEHAATCQRRRRSASVAAIDAAYRSLAAPAGSAYAPLGERDGRGASARVHPTAIIERA